MGAVLRSLSVPVLVVLAAVGGVVAQAVRGLDDSRHDLEVRFATRAEVAVSFVSAYVDDVFARIALEAQRHLTGESPSPEDVADVANGQRTDVALLIGDDGRVIGSYPHNEAIIGVDVSASYEELAAAVRGERTVSGVVEVPGLPPFISLNLPFETPFGRRVYAAGFDASVTLISTFLVNASADGAYAAHLVDDQGQIVASSTGVTGLLERYAPALAVELDAPHDGLFSIGDDHLYAADTVDGTPWTFVLAVKEAELYAPLRDVRRSTSVVVVALALGTAWILGLLVVARRRGAQLASIAVTDPLTEAGNRRSLDRWVAGVPDTTPIATIVVDLDGFKATNDVFGHQVGDEVLHAVACRLRLAVRSADSVVRWGGDEFAIVLRDVDATVARQFAERVRAVIAQPVATSVGDIALSGSIGTATGVAGAVHEAFGRADLALLEAKRSGRNRVVAADERPPEI